MLASQTRLHTFAGILLIDREAVNSAECMEAAHYGHTVSRFSHDILLELETLLCRVGTLAAYTPVSFQLYFAGHTA